MKKTNTKENNEIIEIPAEEAPYALPDGWRWVRLEQISEIIMGQSPSGDSTTDDPSFLPLIGGAADMGAVYPKISRYTKIPTKISKKDDLILCVRATLGRPIFSDGEYCLGRGVAAVRSNLLVKEYLRYFFISFEQYFYDNATGSTFAQISSEILKKMPIPLPQLETQKRIVDRIESLFAKLDEAKEKAQTALDTFELRKSAILHKAFTGELTAQWRQEHGIGLDSWEETKLEKGIKLLSGQDFKPSQYNDTNDGLPYITGASNFDEDHVIINRWTPSPSVIAQKDDVLVVCKGSGYGKTIIADFDKAHIARQIMAIRVNGRVLNRFVFYYLQSEYEYLRNSGQGLIPGIARNIILSMPISIPPIEEQDEIVKIIERVFSREQQAKEAAEAVIEKIDLMKKSILARAFRGEL